MPRSVSAWQDDFALFKEASRICVFTRLWDDPATTAPLSVDDFSALPVRAADMGRRAVAAAGLTGVSVVDGYEACPLFQQTLLSQPDLSTLWITVHLALRPAGAHSSADDLALLTVAVTMQRYWEFWDSTDRKILVAPVTSTNIPPDGLLYRKGDDFHARLDALLDRVFRRLAVAMTPIPRGALGPPVLP